MPATATIGNTEHEGSVNDIQPDNYDSTEAAHNAHQNELNLLRVPSYSHLADGQYPDGLDLRYEAEGYPPPPVYMVPLPSPAMPIFSPSEIPLDMFLEEWMIDYDSNNYLFLSNRVIVPMSVRFERTDTVVTELVNFHHMVIDSEVNKMHVDHFAAVLGAIGKYCKELLIIAPIATTDLGNVFDRDPSDPGAGTDWNTIFQCFPNVEKISFERREELAASELREMMFSAHCALAAGQCVRNLRELRLNVSDEVCQNLLADLALYDKEGGSARHLVGRPSPLSLAASVRSTWASESKVWQKEG